MRATPTAVTAATTRVTRSHGRPARSVGSGRGRVENGTVSSARRCSLASPERAQQQHRHHQREHDQLGRPALGEVGEADLLDDAEADARRERGGQVDHPTDERRRQRSCHHAGPSTSLLTVPLPGLRRIAVSACQQRGDDPVWSTTGGPRCPPAGGLGIRRHRLDPQARPCGPEQIRDRRRRQRGEQQDHEVAARRTNPPT